MNVFTALENSFINLKQLVLGLVVFYLVLALVAALPFLVCGVLNPLDAYVEGMSMVTTTGVTMIGIDELPGLFIVWRSLMEWLGGFFAVLFFALLLPRLVHSPIFAFNRELGEYTDWRSLPEGLASVKLLACFYVGFTVCVGLGLLCFGLNCFDALNFALTLVSTGGMSGGDCFTGWHLGRGLKIFLALVMLVSGGNYVWYYFLSTGKAFKILRDQQFRYYVSGILGAVLLLWFSGKYAGLQSIWVDNLCQVVSCLSTTGYVFMERTNLSGFTYLVLAVLVFVGGCAGSPAGGMKICRCLLCWKLVDCNVRSVYRPNLVQQVDYNGKGFSENSLRYVSLFFFAYVMVIVLVGLVLAADGLMPVDAVVTAVGLVSNSGSMVNVAYMGWFTKLVMTLGMLAGRLEILVMLLMLLPEFWQRKSNW